MPAIHNNNVHPSFARPSSKKANTMMNEDTIADESLYTQSLHHHHHVDLDRSYLDRSYMETSTCTPKMNNTFEQRLLPYEHNNISIDEQTLNDESVYTNGEEEEDVLEDEPHHGNSYGEYRSGLLNRVSPSNKALGDSARSSSSSLNNDHAMVSSIVVKSQQNSLLSSLVSTPSTVSPQSDPSHTPNSIASPSDAMNRIVPYNPSNASSPPAAVRSPPTSLFQSDTNLMDTKMNPSMARKHAAMRMGGQVPVVHNHNKPTRVEREVFVDDDDTSTIDSRPSVDSSLGQKLQRFSRRIAKYQAFAENENASLTFTDMDEESRASSSLPSTLKLAQFLLQQSFVAPVDPENDTLDQQSARQRQGRYYHGAEEEQAFVHDSSFWNTDSSAQLEGGIFYGEPPNQNIHRSAVATDCNCLVDTTCFLPGYRGSKTHDSNKNKRQLKLRRLACGLLFVALLCGIVLVVMVLNGTIDAGWMKGPSDGDSVGEAEKPIYDVVGTDSTPNPAPVVATPTSPAPASQPSTQGSSQTTNGGVASTPLPSETPSVAPVGVESMSPSMSPSQSLSSSPSQTLGETSAPSESTSSSPSGQPTLVPSGEPTVVASTQPSVQPSSAPSLSPSLAPSAVLESVQGRANHMVSLLEPLSADWGEDYVTLMVHEGSAQNEALMSIASRDDFALLSGHELAQLYSMLVLQISLGDVTARRRMNAVSSNICTWVGVTCNPHNEPIQLMWSEKQLSGAIPSEIALLFTLEEIYMENNSISGAIPESMGELVGLRKLKLNGNSIVGPLPSSLANCVQLEELDLSGNGFDSDLPEAIGSLANLKYLALDDNSFSGSIPSSYSGLTKLISLSMADNSLSGSIGLLQSLINLVTLVLHSNEFSGEIPNFSSLSKLRKLDLSANEFSGSIPETLSQCSKLQELLLYSNDLVGRPPDELEDLSKLKTIRLEQNNLDREPKKKFCNMISRENVEFWSDCGGPENYNCKCCTMCCDQDGECVEN